MKTTLLLLALSMSGCSLFKGLAPPPEQPAEPPVDYVGLVLKNTIALSTTFDGDEEPTVFCSGVAVDGTFLTADHCIEPFYREENKGRPWHIHFRGGEPYRGVVVVRWTAMDLAVIDAVGAKTKETLEVSPWEPDYGVKVVWTGFPGGSPHVHIFHGFVSAPVDTAQPHLFNVDGQFIPGNSGGPVLDERGRVLGIIGGTSLAMGPVIPQLIDIGHAVRPEHIRTILKTN